MRFRSTRHVSPDVDWKTAVRQGLAPDGGLYVPTEIPTVRIPKAPVASARSSANSAAHRAAVALSVIHPFFEEMARDDLHALLADALDFEIPLVELGDGIHLLELFHGPTCAFKDVGARCLARWLGWLATAGEPLTVLVATSGDTGSAVAQAFHGVAGTRVVILYPEGKVSPLQEKQFATLGGNVFALAVDGTFDDCQRLVKQAFADDDLRERRRLTSANSINVGRYIPQAFYYPYAAGLLARPDGPVLFSVPSGNFGNLCAGLLAKRMAMPNARFVAATNANDVVPEYLDTGRFRPRASLRTISNAMDVGDPSNFDRILDLYGGDVDAIRADVRGSRHDDESTRAAVRDAFEQTGRILDPHTAVGWLGARDARREFDGPIVVLATAHPAKFREVIEPVIEASVTLPESLRACIELPTRSTPMAADFARFRDWLVSASLESDDA